MSGNQIKVGAEYKNHDPEVTIAVSSIHGKGKNAEVVYVHVAGKKTGKYGICTLTDFAKAATSRVE